MPIRAEPIIIPASPAPPSRRKPRRLRVFSVVVIWLLSELLCTVLIVLRYVKAGCVVLRHAVHFLTLLSKGTGCFTICHTASLTRHPASARLLSRCSPSRRIPHPE